MKRTPRKPRSSQDRDPLFNQSVEKAFAILEAFGGERRGLNLREGSTAVGMTKSSAQRCTHTLERLGYLRRDPRVKRWVLTPQALNMAHSYLRATRSSSRRRLISSTSTRLAVSR